LEKVQKKLTLQVTKEGYIIDDTVTIDANSFEARDQAPYCILHPYLWLI